MYTLHAFTAYWVSAFSIDLHLLKFYGVVIMLMFFMKFVVQVLCNKALLYMFILDFAQMVTLRNMYKKFRQRTCRNQRWLVPFIDGSIRHGTVEVFPYVDGTVPLIYGQFRDELSANRRNPLWKFRQVCCRNFFRSFTENFLTVYFVHSVVNLG